ncbi:MAG: YHYH protein, partial [Phycisphaerales bacterium]|nr:YHYH protein [Phycisphaerales bacterium]
MDAVRALNGAPATAAAAPPADTRPGGERSGGERRPPQAAPFDLFAPFVLTRWDDRWLYVESDGLPHAPVEHPMMVGIRSWQQQVPLPQNYRGDNAWRIPLRPELADKPVSGRTELRRGAIALAANGVPIFNALNNRGDDALKAGELDEFGGHSGRADDYHYHAAPLHLQKVVGNARPIAYALDGYPIFGLFEPGAAAGSTRACPLGGRDPLDELNGHFAPAPEGSAPGAKGLYHYHASLEYPYINGGMRGKVTVVDDQIEPQPRARPVRQWLTPLRGAAITGFRKIGEQSWSLEYTIANRTAQVNYRIEGTGAGERYIFDFIGADGAKRTETYT